MSKHELAILILEDQLPVLDQDARQDLRATIEFLRSCVRTFAVVATDRRSGERIAAVKHIRDVALYRGLTMPTLRETITLLDRVDAGAPQAIATECSPEQVAVIQRLCASTLTLKAIPTDIYLTSLV